MDPKGAGPSDRDEWLIPSLESIARGERKSIESYLHTLGSTSLLGGTKSYVRTHWVIADGNGRPRVDALATRLAEEVIHYCIPRSKIEEAHETLRTTGSWHKVARLQTEARELFSRLDTSGEGGELLLYFLLEAHLRIPQILSKMSMKTNANVHFHGVDGVHAEALQGGTLAVYWGESKIYDDFGKAISACFDSIEPFLNDAGGGPLQRDIHLVRDRVDSGDRDLTLALARYFDSDEPDATRLEVRGACLIGFSHDDYLNPFMPDGKTLVSSISTILSDWQTKIAARVKGKNIHEFHIEVFCVPLPSAAEFRNCMKSALGLES